MNEGWTGDSYLIAFDDAESIQMTVAYGLSDYLPDYRIVGLLGWDDFLLVDARGRQFRIPTVPLDVQHLAKHDTPYDVSSLRRDARFTGRIKWYTKPLVFGGDPACQENIAWVGTHTHQRWWNQKYREGCQGTQAGPSGTIGRGQPVNGRDDV